MGEKRYYCKFCRSIFYHGWYKDGQTMPIEEYCPVCKDNSHVKEIPAFETVLQWEERVGEEYPETAPIYHYLNGDFWYVDTYAGAKHCKIPTNEIIVASEVGAPPDNWWPE